MSAEGDRMVMEARAAEKKWLTRYEDSQVALTAEREAREHAEALLTRISGWDHMDTAADGAYWRAEIAAYFAREDK